MSFDNAFFATSGHGFYPNKEDELNGLYMNTVQDPFGTLNWTTPDSLNHGTLMPSFQPSVPLYENGFFNACPSLLPNPDLAIPGAGTFDFSLLNSALLSPPFVPTQASPRGLYAGDYLKIPPTASEFFLTNAGMMPTFGHLGCSPVGPSFALPQTGIQQDDTACISALMEILAPSMGGMYGESVSAQVPVPEVLPPPPSPSTTSPSMISPSTTPHSTTYTFNTKKVSRAKGKTRSYASRSVSKHLTEPKPSSDEKKTYTCRNVACGKELKTKKSWKRHELIHFANPYFCAYPRCRTNIKKDELGFNRDFSMRRHLNGRLNGKMGEQHPCVLAARALGWTGRDCTEDYLIRDGPPPLE